MTSLGTPPDAPTTAPAPRRRPRIVVAEDDEVVRQFIRATLESEHEIIEAGDGEAAWAAILEQRPDLVLADVMMPKLDGLELLQRIRSDPATANLPVIMLSARSDEESRIKGMEMQADDYLTKPISARELQARIDTHLELDRMRRSTAEKLRAARDEAERAVRDRTAELAASNQALREREEQLRRVNAELAERVAALEAAERNARASRRATLNVLEDAVASRRLAELLNRNLQDEIAIRRRAQEDLQRRAVADAFRVALADALRALSDPADIRRAAATLLGRHLRVNRVTYGEIASNGEAQVGCDYAEGVPCLPARLNLSDFGVEVYEILRSGRTAVIADVRELPSYPERQSAWTEIQVGAYLAIPLVKHGELVAGMSIDQTTPRDWQPDEVALAEETAERTWSAIERARAERAVEEDLRDTRLLRDVSERLIAEGDIQIFHTEVLAAAIALTRADAGTVQMLDASRQELQLLASRGFQPEMLERFARVDAASGTSCGRALAAGRRVLVDYDEREASDPDCSHQLHREAGFLSAQSTPLVSRSGRSIGMLSTHWHRHHRPRERELRFLDLLARQAADAIERRTAEQALRESEERARALIGNLPGGAVFIVDRDLRFRLAEGEALQHARGAGNDFVGQTIFEVLDSGLAATCAPLYQQALAGERFEHEHAFEGQFFFSRGAPLRAANGEIHAALVVWYDITERKRAEHALRVNEEQVRRAIEEAPIPVIMYAEEGQVLQLSKAWTQLTGFAQQDMPSFDAWLTHAYGEGADNVREHMRDLFKGNRRVLNVEFPIHTRAGEVRHWSFSASSPGWLHDGRRFIVAMALDVTERRVAEDALRENHGRLEIALEAARNAAKAKDRFLAALSHELRTPLTPVLLTLSMVEEDATTPEILREDLAMMRRNIETEARMVDDLLDLSRIMNQKLELELQAVDAQEVVQRAVEVCAPGAQEKELELVVRLEAGRTQVRADPNRLQQVFWNLIQNAVKFTPEHGTITISSRERDNRLLIEVADTGRGIEAAMLAKIFEPFEQAGRQGREAQQGLGLGLAIAQRIVAAHAGELRVSSAGRDQGATFVVELALAETPAAAVPPRRVKLTTREQRRTPRSPVA